MPTFCRHGRFIQNCSICKAPDPPASATRRPSSARRPSSRGRGAGRGSSASGLVVRRAERAAADGYESPLLPGIAASADAERLADELAFSAGRLAELATDPPDDYAQAASSPDPEQAISGVFEITCAGERGVADPAAAGAAFGAWAARAGGAAAGLLGEPAWSPERRFDRGFDRLALPRLTRAVRFDFLTVLGRLGLADVSPGTLKLSLPDEVNVAAKRVFGIGDPLLLDRRAKDLADAAGVPLAALDLGLFNWSRGEGDRVLMGASPDASADRDAVAAALGL
jgi:hypothetical protein